MKNEKNKILIYGAGVIGSLYAAKLSASGCDVTVLARGSRLNELRVHGLRYNEKNGIKRAKVNVVSELAKEQEFDYIFLTVRAEQVKQALEMLKENKSKTIVTMVNSLGNYGEWEKIAGKNRILPAFPGAGGSIEGGILKADLTPAIIQPTTFGEIRGKKTRRVMYLKKLLASAGIPVQIVPDMHIWQICHLAMVVPLADAYYMTKKEPYKVAWDKNTMKKTAKQLKSNFCLLRKKGIRLSPGKLNLIYYIPVDLLAWVLKCVYKSSFGDMFMYQHAIKARSEMEELHTEIYEYLGVK